MYKITILFLFFGFCTYAQKAYHFDHLLEYTYQQIKDSSSEKIMILTNSKEGYHASVKISENGEYNVCVTDHEGLIASFAVDKEDFWNYLNLEVPCELVQKLKTIQKWEANKYEFEKQKDTIINSVEYPRYIYKDVKPKREKRMQSGRTHYVMEPDTEYHAPVFFFHKQYYTWKEKSSNLSGIPKYRYEVRSNQEVCSVFSLSKISKFEKVLHLACEF